MSKLKMETGAEWPAQEQQASRLVDASLRNSRDHVWLTRHSCGVQRMYFLNFTMK